MTSSAAHVAGIDQARNALLNEDGVPEGARRGEVAGDMSIGCVGLQDADIGVSTLSAARAREILEAEGNDPDDGPDESRVIYISARPVWRFKSHEARELAYTLLAAADLADEEDAK